MDLFIYNCEGCSSTFMDLIKCNLCTKFVCEGCSRVIVGKIKVGTQNCKSVNFICNNCEGAIDKVNESYAERMKNPIPSTQGTLSKPSRNNSRSSKRARATKGAGSNSSQLYNPRFSRAG